MAGVMFATKIANQSANKAAGDASVFKEPNAALGRTILGKGLSGPAASASSSDPAGYLLMRGA